MSTNPEYIYSEESENFSFFRIPRALVKDERFRDLSTDSKLLYGLMLDRIALSLQNGWQDTEGRAFIYFTLEEIQATLSCGHNKAVRLLAELDRYALIERVKQGQGKPAKIYVKKIPTTDADSGEDTENDSIPSEATDLKRSEKPTCSPPVLKRLDFPKGDGNYTDTNSIHPSILTTRGRPQHHPKTNHLQLTHHTETAPLTALSEQVCHVLNTRPLLGGKHPQAPMRQWRTCHEDTSTLHRPMAERGRIRPAYDAMRCVRIIRQHRTPQGNHGY